jgi:hypothetical protein
MLASPRTQAPRRHPQHVRTDMSLTTCSRRRAPRPRDVTRSMSARTCPSRHARVAAHPGPATSSAACPHGHVPHDLHPHVAAHPGPATSPAACPHGHVPHDIHARVAAHPGPASPAACPHGLTRRRTPRPRDVTRSMSARTCPSRHTCSRRRAPRPRDVTRSMSARTCPSRHARVAAHPGPLRRHPQHVRTDTRTSPQALCVPRRDKRVPRDMSEQRQRAPRAGGGPALGAGDRLVLQRKPGCPGAGGRGDRVEREGYRRHNA